jgi:hypothetical protein
VSSREPLRIGDAERNRAAELLGEHMAEGRLTQAEFDERLSAALNAKVAADLEPLFRDLPGPNPGKPTELSLQEQTRKRADELMAEAKAKQEVQPVANPKMITALSVATTLAWIGGMIICFRYTWDYWYVLLIPVGLSIITGKLKGSFH